MKKSNCVRIALVVPVRFPLDPSNPHAWKLCICFLAKRTSCTKRRRHHLSYQRNHYQEIIMIKDVVQNSPSWTARERFIPCRSKTPKTPCHRMSFWTMNGLDQTLRFHTQNMTAITASNGAKEDSKVEIPVAGMDCGDTSQREWTMDVEYSVYFFMHGPLKAKFSGLTKS